MKKLLIILGVVLGLTLALSNGKFLRVLEEETSQSEDSISELSSYSEESISELSDLSTEESEEESEGLRRLLKGRKPNKGDRDGEEKPDRDGESRPHGDGEARPQLRKCKTALRRIFRACKKDSESKKCSLEKLEGKCLEIGCKVAEKTEISFPQCEDEESEGLRRLLKGKKPNKDEGDRDGEEKPHGDGESRPHGDGEARPQLRKCKTALRRIFRACKKDPQSKKCSLEKVKGKCLEFGCKVAEKTEISFPECKEE